MKALDLPQVILKAAVIIPEGMARHTKAAGRIDLVHEILGRDPLVREAVDAECSNISPERKIFHSHKDRKTGLPGIPLSRFLQTHAVMVRDADRIQPPFPCSGNDLLQRHLTVTGACGFM